MPAALSGVSVSSGPARKQHASAPKRNETVSSGAKKGKSVVGDDEPPRVTSALWRFLLVAVGYVMVSLLRIFLILPLPTSAVEGLMPILHAALAVPQGRHPQAVGDADPQQQRSRASYPFVEQLLFWIAAILFFDSATLERISVQLLALNVLQWCFSSLVPSVAVYVFCAVFASDPALWESLAAGVVKYTGLVVVPAVAAQSSAAVVAFSRGRPPSWLVAYCLSFSIQHFLSVNCVVVTHRRLVWGLVVDTFAHVCVICREWCQSTSAGKAVVTLLQTATHFVVPEFFMAAALWYALMLVDWNTGISLGGVLLSGSMVLGPASAASHGSSARIRGFLEAGQTAAPIEQQGEETRQREQAHRARILFMVSVLAIDAVVYCFASPKLVTVLANGILSAHFVLFIGNHSRLPAIVTMVPLGCLWLGMVALDLRMQVHHAAAALGGDATLLMGYLSETTPDISAFRYAVAVNTAGFGLLLLASTLGDISRAVHVAEEDLRVLQFLTQRRSLGATEKSSAGEATVEKGKYSSLVRSGSSDVDALCDIAVSELGLTDEHRTAQATGAAAGVGARRNSESSVSSQTSQVNIVDAQSSKAATLAALANSSETAVPNDMSLSAGCPPAIAPNHSMTSDSMVSSAAPSHTSRSQTPTQHPAVPLTATAAKKLKKKAAELQLVQQVEDESANAAAAVTPSDCVKSETSEKQQTASERSKKERHKREQEAVAAAAAAELERKRMQTAKTSSKEGSQTTDSPPVVVPPSSGEIAALQKAKVSAAASAAATIALKVSGPVTESAPVEQPAPPPYNSASKAPQVPPSAVDASPQPQRCAELHPPQNTGKPTATVKQAPAAPGSKLTFGDVVRGAKVGPPPAASGPLPAQLTVVAAASGPPLSVDGALPSQASKGSKQLLPSGRSATNSSRPSTVASVDGSVDASVTGKMIPQPKSVQLRAARDAAAAQAPNTVTSPLVKASKAIMSIDMDDDDDGEVLVIDEADYVVLAAGGRDDSAASGAIIVPPSPNVVARLPPISPQRLPQDHAGTKRRARGGDLPSVVSESKAFDAFVGMSLLTGSSPRDQNPPLMEAALVSASETQVENGGVSNYQTLEPGVSDATTVIDLAKFHLALTGSSLRAGVDEASNSPTIGAAPHPPPSNVPSAARLDDMISQLSSGNSPLPRDDDSATPTFPRPLSQFVTLNELTRAVSSVEPGIAHGRLQADAVAPPAPASDSSSSAAVGGDSLDNLLSQGFMHLLDDDSAAPTSTQQPSLSASALSNTYPYHMGHQYAGMQQLSAPSVQGMLHAQQQPTAITLSALQGNHEYARLMQQSTVMAPAFPASSTAGGFTVTSGGSSAPPYGAAMMHPAAFSQVSGAVGPPGSAPASISPVISTNQGPFVVVTLATGQQLMCPVLYQQQGAPQQQATPQLQPQYYAPGQQPNRASGGYLQPSVSPTKN